MDKRKRHCRNSIVIILTGIIMLLASYVGSFTTEAGEISVEIAAKSYQFDKNSGYEISSSAPKTAFSDHPGTFNIKGDMTSIASVNGFEAYDVKNGSIRLSYDFNKSYLNRGETEWHLVNDGTKKVDGVQLEKNIQSGAMILQTSLDGKNWVVDQSMTDVFTSNSTQTYDFYSTKDIQLVNGCYYRVIVVYKVERKSGENQVLFVTTNEMEYQKIADVYEFYAINQAEASKATSPSTTPRKEFHDFINTGKDNGFSGSVAINNKDPHFGWELGYFVINGYTRDLTKDGQNYFLKNVGDRVTLWFHLNQNINQLNGNAKITVAEDKNAYDQVFSIKNTNFKHGTLVVRYTDREGKPHDPVIYTDFLAANATTGANTKVELFEEGDYEVALDYEIQDASQAFSPVYDYKIAFTFAIRNGNCMVYPFDIVTGAELADRAVTANGFRLDLARSRYLDIDVKREAFTQGASGLEGDVRYNRPATDGEEYKDEGLYTFTVKNLYTGEQTTKMIYVGSNEILRAYMKNPKLSIEDIEEQLANGAHISSDGTIVAPTPTPTPTSTPTPEPTQEEVQESAEADIPTVSATPTLIPTPTPTPAPTMIALNEKESDDAGNVERNLPEENASKTGEEEHITTKKSPVGAIIVILALAIGGGIAAYFKMKK